MAATRSCKYQEGNRDLQHQSDVSITETLAGLYTAFNIMAQGKDCKGDWHSPTQSLPANDFMSCVPPLYGLNYFVRMIENSQQVEILLRDILPG
jgi:hypothetical protein